MVEEFTIKARAEVHPSEDKDKVIRAVSNVFNESRFEVKFDGSFVFAYTNDRKALNHIRDVLRDRHVRAAARKIAVDSKSGNSFRMLLNKQAAYEGIIALCSSEQESPLGPIELTFSAQNIDEIIEFLTSYCG